MKEHPALIESLRSEIFNLEELVNYQDNAVISKTRIQKDAGSVTLFALDKGQMLSEHTAPFDALVKILDGTAKVITSYKELKLKEGESTVIPPGKSHSLQASEKFKMLLVMIR